MRGYYSCRRVTFSTPEEVAYGVCMGGYDRGGIGDFTRGAGGQARGPRALSMAVGGAGRKQVLLGKVRAGYVPVPVPLTNEQQ